ncbi:MAG: CerR family C-terminal domain-containing protein [Burkholderiaceae bacterium]|nr:CerR family C-terminal domain-containing protein [Burkholderiaceae bacterium]
MNDHNKVKKSRSDGEQSRERLLLAAMRLFAEHGYAKASTREIALAAGANVAAISYYFGDKAGLYRAAFAAMSLDPHQNIALYDQPDLTLRQSMDIFFTQMLTPLQEGDISQLCSRLWFREMLEPTGLWADEIDHNIRPEHEALVRIISRHLGLAAADDAIHQLAFCVASQALLLMVASDVVTTLTPQLLDGPNAIGPWIERFSSNAVAMIEAEKTARTPNKDTE